MEEVKMKKCSKCGEEKSATNEYFHIDKSKRDKLHTICKRCRNQNETNRRNQLKMENANTPDVHTVYIHVNKINNKIYIGQTKKTNLKDRWRTDGSGYKTQTIFNNDIQKYGWDNFDHDIVASGLTKKEAENFEILLIEKLDTTNPAKGYNAQTGGSYGFTIGNNENMYSKKVFCNDKIFDSAMECAKYYNIKQQTMNTWLTGKRGMRDDFIKFNLHYIDENYKIKTQTKMKNNNLSSKKVFCDNKIFISMTKCSEYYNVKLTTMHSWLKNRNPMPQKFKDMGLRYYVEEETE